MQFHYRSTLGLISTAVVCLAAVVLAGCSGSSNSNASSNSRIRGVDMVGNGGSATIFVNAGALNQALNFEQTSRYLYLKGGSSTVTFTLSNTPNTAYGQITSTLNSGDAYSAIVIGRDDVPTVDSRRPQVIVSLDDQTAPPAGDARVRIIHAAPDLDAVDVSLNGTLIGTSVAYTHPAAYVDVVAGSDTFTFLAAGTSTPVAKSVTYNLSSGGIYSVYLTEPTVSPALTYGTFLTNDGV